MWKLDRLARSTRHLNKLIEHCQDHGKTIVSTSENLDLDTWAGRLLTGVIGGLAEGELSAIKERTTASRAKLRELGRWAGGKPAYGYKAEQTDDGWRLVVDDDAAAVIVRIAGDLLGGKPLGRICAELESEAVASPSRHYRGEAGGKWSTTPVRDLLRRQTLLGIQVHNGVPVRDDLGEPMRIGPAILDRDTWERVQRVLDGNVEVFKNNRLPHDSWLVGSAYCGACGAPLWHNQSSVRRKSGRVDLYRYLRCRDRCGAQQINADELEALVEEHFLADYGDWNVRERVWEPASEDHVALAEAVRALDELTALAGTISSDTARSRLQRQVSALDEKIAELESRPQREGHWKWVEWPETYAEAWEAADAEGRRAILRRAGFKVTARMLGRHGWEVAPRVVEPRRARPRDCSRKTSRRRGASEGVTPTLGYP